MSTSPLKPTRREDRRAQTVREIKGLAMGQISEGGPDAVSLSGIVREMSMSPAALYRYFAGRDALLADLVVDAYNELADHLAGIEQGARPDGEHLAAVLRGSRNWALQYPNAYRLIFQTAIGSGKDFAPERTVPAATRSMAVIVSALAAVAEPHSSGPGTEQSIPISEMSEEIRAWAVRSGFEAFSDGVLTLAFLSWTRLHGIVSLELGGHLAATGIDAAALFEIEVSIIRSQAAGLSLGSTRGGRDAVLPS